MAELDSMDLWKIFISTISSIFCLLFWLLAGIIMSCSLLLWLFFWWRSSFKLLWTTYKCLKLSF